MLAQYGIAQRWDVELYPNRCRRWWTNEKLDVSKDFSRLSEFSWFFQGWDWLLTPVRLARLSWGTLASPASHKQFHVLLELVSRGLAFHPYARLIGDWLPYSQHDTVHRVHERLFLLYLLEYNIVISSTLRARLTVCRKICYNVGNKGCVAATPSHGREGPSIFNVSSKRPRHSLDNGGLGGRLKSPQPVGTVLGNVTSWTSTFALQAKEESVFCLADGKLRNSVQVLWRIGLLACRFVWTVPGFTMVSIYI